MLVQGFYSAYIPERDYSDLDEGTILARGRKACREFLKHNRDVIVRPLLEPWEREKVRIEKRAEARAKLQPKHAQSAPSTHSERDKQASPAKPRPTLVGIWADGTLVRTFDSGKRKPEQILEAWKTECARRPYECLVLGELRPYDRKVGIISVRNAASPLGRAYERPHLRWSADKNRYVKPMHLRTKLHTLAPKGI